MKARPATITKAMKALGQDEFEANGKKNDWRKDLFEQAGLAEPDVHALMRHLHQRRYELEIGGAVVLEVRTDRAENLALHRRITELRHELLVLCERGVQLIEHGSST